MFLNAGGSLIMAQKCNSIGEALKAVKNSENGRFAIKQGRKFKVFYMRHLGFGLKIHTITATAVS